MTYRTQMLPTGCCPRCFNQLTGVAGHGEELRHCANCGGVWLGLDTSRLVTRGADAGFRALAHSLSALREPRSADPLEKVLQCTVCAVELTPINVPSAKVRIDACRDHGTWFDVWELSGVIRAVERVRGYGVGGTVLLSTQTDALGSAGTRDSAERKRAGGPSNAADETAQEAAIAAEADEFASPLRKFMLEAADTLKTLKSKVGKGS